MNDLEHVLVIPDGNRRYATERGMDTKVVYRWISDFTTTELIRFFMITKKIRELSIFGISRNNVVKRDPEGLQEIFNAQAYLAQEWIKNKSFQRAGIRFKLVGDLGLLPKKHLNIIKKLETTTKANKGPLVNLLVAYDGQYEILQALRRIGSKKVHTIGEFYKYLDIKTPIDLVIRTGGEKRFSAAPLFQTSYSEFVFTEYHYPELTIEKLREIVEEYENRQRRFGK